MTYKHTLFNITNEYVRSKDTNNFPNHQQSPLKISLSLPPGQRSNALAPPLEKPKYRSLDFSNPPLNYPLLTLHS